MTHHTDAERADCPVCGGKPFIRRSHDADGMRWSHVECKSCGLRTRGKWVASSSDECPIFFQEVWEEWPRRAPAAPVPQQDVEKLRAELAEEVEAADDWRRLALQFDGHRMQAIGHLKAMLTDPQGSEANALAFIKAPPLHGDAVLAQRIAAIAAAPQPPEHTSSEHSKPMCGAAPKVDPIAWYVTGCSTMLDEHDAKAEAKRCGGMAQAVPLYTEPQPPEAQASVSNGTFAAPVQLPEPAANFWQHGETGRTRVVMPDAITDCDAGWQHVGALYTEQQVRELLAAHGIKVNQ